MNRKDLNVYFEEYGHLVILSGFVVLFIIGFLPSNIGWLGVKLLIFLSLLFLAYHYFSLAQDENGSLETETIPDEAQQWLNLENERDIEEHFEAFLKTILRLIKQNLVADTAVLLFANYQK